MTPLYWTEECFSLKLHLAIEEASAFEIKNSQNLTAPLVSTEAKEEVVKG